MTKFALLLISLGSLLLASAAVFSLSSEVHADDKTWQDPTCHEVNEAYLKTRSYPHYSVQMPLIREDGSTKPYMVYVVTESEHRAWRAFDKKWIATKRTTYGTWDRFLPKFTDCTLLGDEVTPDGPVTHYAVLWNNFPYQARTDVWILRSEGLLRRIRRHFPDSRWQFSEATIEEIFEYGSDVPPRLAR